MSISLILIGITVLVSVLGFNNPTLQSKLIHNPFLVSRRNEYHRLVTSGFVHAGWAHLGFNMLSFFFFGRTVETVYIAQYGELYGTLIFIGLYLITIVISDLPSLFKYKDMPAYSSLGASGGVSAIVFASILFAPTAKMIIFPIPFPIPGFILGVLYVFYSYYQDKRSSDNINHAAHLWGAVSGFVISALLIPDSLSNFVAQLSDWRMF